MPVIPSLRSCPLTSLPSSFWLIPLFCPLAGGNQNVSRHPNWLAGFRWAWEPWTALCLISASRAWLGTHSSMRGHSWGSCPPWHLQASEFLDHRGRDASLLTLGVMVSHQSTLLPSAPREPGSWLVSWILYNEMISPCCCIRATLQVLAKQGFLLLLSPGPKACHKKTLKRLPFLIAPHPLGNFPGGSAWRIIHCSTWKCPVGQRAGWACCDLAECVSMLLPVL